MKKWLITAIAAMVFFRVLGCTDDDGAGDIADRLGAIEGMTVEELTSSNPGYRFFSLQYVQPADHNNPSGAAFSQSMKLIHISTDAPMVFMPMGYAGMDVDELQELTQMLGANQLAVEHRFFRTSRPEPADWTLLTIKQAAADHHRIVEALKPIYEAAWISTGGSKGGMTATYHRRFYPDDVDGTVAYVAPLSLGAPDERYIDFLNNIGDQDCLAKLRAIQVEVLTRREAMVTLLSAQATETNASFNRIGGLERAIESVILDFPFTFWQYFGIASCSSVPEATATDQEIFDFVNQIIAFQMASDSAFDFLDPYYYQAASELGYPDLATSHLAGLLLTDAPSTEQGLIPEGVAPPTYNPNAMLDIAEWVETEGNRLIFIYGQWDPWTTGAYELGAATDSFKFIVPNGTHGSRMSQLNAEDKAVVLDALQRWTGVTPKLISISPRSFIPRDSRTGQLINTGKRHETH